MSFDRLYADHVEIDRIAQALLAHVSAAPDVGAAMRVLERLTALLRAHVAQEDPVIYTTLELARHGRHGATALAAARELEELKEDWANYVYRWDRDQVARDWTGFAAATRLVLARLRERVTWETSVLYALAVHHGVIRGSD